MSGREHTYRVSMTWTGSRGVGTVGYTAYDRDHDIVIEGKPVIHGSSDPAFRGDASRHNPEELLVAALSSCHMLWFLHLCAEAGVTVMSYHDDAWGVMEEDGSGGRFTRVTLRPAVTIAAGDPDRAFQLHHAAHDACFIARSVSFPVRVEPVIPQ